MMKRVMLEGVKIISCITGTQVTVLNTQEWLFCFCGLARKLQKSCDEEH